MADEVPSRNQEPRSRCRRQKDKIEANSKAKVERKSAEKTNNAAERESIIKDGREIKQNTETDNTDERLTVAKHGATVEETEMQDKIKTLPNIKETEKKTNSNDTTGKEDEREIESLATREMDKITVTSVPKLTSVDNSEDNQADTSVRPEEEQIVKNGETLEKLEKKIRKKLKSDVGNTGKEASFANKAAELNAPKSCSVVTGMSAGALRVLGSGGLKGSSLPLLLSMSTGGAGGISLLPAGLPPGRYVILPSTTTSIPSISSIAPTTIQAGGTPAFITATTDNSNSASIPSVSVKSPLVSPVRVKQSTTVPTVASGRFLRVGRGVKGAVGGRGPVGVQGRRKSYTAAEKLAMIEAVESGQRKSVVADMFGVAPSTLACILLQKHKIRTDQDLTRRRLRHPKSSHFAPFASNNSASAKELDAEEGELPFGTHFLSPLSPTRPTILEESPEEIVSVPDLGERLTGGDGPSGTKVDATPSSFLPCSPILHGSLDDLGAPSLNYQDSLCHREARSDFSQSEHVDIKTEPLFPSQTEIDDDSIVGNTQSSGPPSRQQSPIPPGMTGPYLLKKETHCNTILDELMKDETFTDVTLTAEGQHIKAHRIILCLSSKYFKEVLSKDSNAKNIIFFRDIKFEELKNIISFIYTGEVTVDATDLESFMKTAELLEVTSLCEGQKNFPKGFPLYRNPEPSSSEIPKVSAATKRSSTSDAHSPPLKSRKVNAEAAVQRPSRKFHQAAASYSPPVIKPEPLSQSDIEEETTKEAGDNKEDIYSDLGSKDTDRANEEKETHTGSSSDYEETFQAGRKEEAEPPGVGDITTTTTPGRCPFCPATQILFTGSAILTHLQVSHSDETAYPCENCYRVFTTKSIFLGHHRDCAR